MKRRMCTTFMVTKQRYAASLTLQGFLGMRGPGVERPPFWSNESRTAVYASKEILSQNNVLRQRNQTQCMYTDVSNVYPLPQRIYNWKISLGKCILMRGLMT